MCAGWIKLHKKMTKWQWFKHSNTLQLFIYVLITANYEDKYWGNVLVKRGELITSLGHLAEGTGLSVQQVRTALENLYSSGELIRQEKNNKHFTHLTICNYSIYQENTESSNNQITIKQQSNNNQITTTKEYKNIRNKEEYISNKLDMVNFSNLPENEVVSLENIQPKRRQSFLAKYKDLKFAEDTNEYKLGLSLGKALASKNDLKDLTDFNKQELARVIYHLTKTKNYDIEDIASNINFLKNYDKYPADRISTITTFNQFYKELNQVRKNKNYGNELSITAAESILNVIRSGRN